MVEIKFCGLTRASDAAFAAALGARYVGVVLAPGPRKVDPATAARVLDAAGDSVRRVGVFVSAAPDEIARAVRAARLDVVQLHGDPSAELLQRVRDATGAAVWAVRRVGRGALDSPDGLAELDALADGILLDTFAPDRPGGTGIPFDWSAVAAVERPRRAMLVVAGGLTPDNVRAAIAALAPDVVDVSSGVEQAPGIKSHERMRAFAAAVRGEEETR